MTGSKEENQAKSWRRKRRNRREQQNDEKEDSFASMGLDENDNDYVPYVSTAKRLRMEREAVVLAAAGASDNGGGGTDGDEEQQQQQSTNSKNIGQRRSRKLLAAIGSNKSQLQTAISKGVNDSDDDSNGSRDHSDDVGKIKDESDGNGKTVEKETMSLLDEAAALQKKHSSNNTLGTGSNSVENEESRILREASQVQTNALQAANELAQGVSYKTPFRTTWKPPTYIMKQGPEKWNLIRKKWHILVESTDKEESEIEADCPPPLKSFQDMKLPPPILDALKEKNIQRPTPIQMQGLPVALAGRDLIGIAFTGSGKTLTFSLPLVMAALEEELKNPIIANEGPLGFILAPSRELARQTFDIVQFFCEKISNYGHGYPRLYSQLFIGGENPKEQLQPLREHGIHCLVATPGRLRDFLKKKSMNLNNCRYICMDEADRMLDLGFDEEVGEIMNFFHHQRQTLLFSATFPKKFQDFAKNTLVKPVVVNVGRAGAANLDVIQEVEYVKQEAKIVYLLECLQKTAPPVIVFCERKGDVDDIHEYLLLKGVEAVSIHGGKDQEERNEAIQLYKDGKKDILVATDVAAKGLDFANIKHVINFDMPSEIENYVHRIGRTGRCGKTGVATTFINKSCEETTLLDLKHLLLEAHQRIPPVLMIMDDPLSAMSNNGNDGKKGCAFCGGLGHSIVDCPKIDKDARRVSSKHKDALASGDGYGGDW